MFTAIRNALASRKIRRARQLETVSFRGAVAAAKLAYDRKDFDKVMENCRVALQIANATDSQAGKAAVFKIMNTVRAEQRAAARSGEIVPMSYVDRARVINAAMNAEIQETGRIISAVCAAAVIGAAAFFFSVGLNLPGDRSTATYDLVQFVGEESDIIDYDLSATDCASYMAQSRHSGLTVACELASN